MQLLMNVMSYIRYIWTELVIEVYRHTNSLINFNLLKIPFAKRFLIKDEKH